MGMSLYYALCSIMMVLVRACLCLVRCLFYLQNVCIMMCCVRVVRFFRLFVNWENLRNTQRMKP